MKEISRSKSDYEILGIGEDADRTQVKRAYFKRIRSHSPETDPEGFAEIREAYERLMSGEKKEDGPGFVIPSDKIIRMFVDQIRSCRKEGRYSFALDTAQEAGRLFPKVDLFFYETAQLQRRCGFTGKAVKTAKMLVDRDPSNRWYWRELALANLERGFIKKALPAFERAYELGNTDEDFIMMYAQECEHVGAFDTALKLLVRLAPEDRRWKKEDIPLALAIYEGIGICTRHLDQDREKWAEQFITFIEQYRLFLSDNLYGCTDVVGEMTEGNLDYKVWNRQISTLEKLIEGSSTDNSIARECREWITGFKLSRLRWDDRICMSLEYRAELMFNPDAERFHRIDCELCLMQEREKILAIENVLREEYPWLYEGLLPLLGRMKDERDLPAYIRKKTQEYLRMTEFYGDGHYFRQFPEMKQKSQGKIIATSETPYIRTGKKIGRNDPCPCGSGKKYKQCCGRNR